MHKDFLSPGDLPATAGLKEGKRPPGYTSAPDSDLFDADVMRLRGHSSQDYFLSTGSKFARCEMQCVQRHAPRLAVFFRFQLGQMRRICAQVAGRDENVNRSPPREEQEPVPEAGR